MQRNDPVWRPPEESGPPPAVPAGAALIAGLLALGAFGFVCCGGGFSSVLALALRERTTQLRSAVGEMRAAAERRAQTEELLDVLSDRLEAERMTRRQYPARLPGSSPEDGWGTPLRYEQQGPDAALLRSAGPDRTFGTADDLNRELGE